jgi:LPXTG-motif cell wall-anchored protein
MTLPSMNVPDGFFVDFALLLTDGALNLNATDFQRVTAASQVAVPEPGVGLLGAVLAGAAFVVQRRRRRNAAV